MSKCPKCDNELKLIQKCTVRDKEFHLYRCLNCRRLFIENNIENEKEVFDSFIKTPDFLEEKLQYFISYLISKGRFIYAKEYVELYKSKFTADSRLLMNEFLINLRCKNENDLQFYIKNVKDFDQLNNLILSLENDKRQKLTKFFLVSLTNCANIFGGSDLLKCDKIFENILGISNTPQIFKKEIAGFAKVCVNKNNNEIAEKYYSLIGENLKEKNYSIDHSTLPNNKKTNESKKQETDQTKFQREEKHHDESKIQEKTQEKEQKDKIKKIRVKKPASEKSGKIKRIVLGVCSAIFIIAIVIVGAFYFKGGFKSNNLNDSLEDSSNTNNGFQTETFAILPIEGNYTIVADYYENQLQPAHGDIWEVHFGVDFSSDTSKNVFAVKTGKITSIEKNNINLFTVTIYHNDGVYTCYENLENHNFKIGQIIKQGDNIGAYHGNFVHFEVLEYGVYINPHIFLNLNT